MTAHRSKHKKPTKMYYVQRVGVEPDEWHFERGLFTQNQHLTIARCPQGASNVLRMLVRMGIPARRVEVV